MAKKKQEVVEVDEKEIDDIVEQENLSPEEAKKRKAELRKQKFLDSNKKAKKTISNFFSEFKAFMNRGNAMNLAVGVVIGGAFTAIVTALSNILLSVCTWGIPGGINGLITVLPAANNLQGCSDLGGAQCFNSLDALKAACAQHSVADVDAVVSQFTLYGSKYVYNGAAIINWGAVINAAIAFVTIALVLFIIVKVITVIKKKQDETYLKMLEAYYTKHPEERPVVEEKPKEPTEKDLLKDILKTLKSINTNSNSQVKVEKVSKKK